MRRLSYTTLVKIIEQIGRTDASINGIAAAVSEAINTLESLEVVELAEKEESERHRARVEKLSEERARLRNLCKHVMDESESYPQCPICQVVRS